MKKIGYVICLTITFLTFMFLFPITSKAAGFDSESPKVVQYYLDEDGNQVRNPKTDLPTYIVFKPGTEHYKAYGNTKLWEHQHMGCYLWYTITEPIPHKQTTKESIDYSRIIENRAERSSLDYEWLVERKKGIYQNLKLGSKIPNKHGYDSFVGENTGTTLIVNPSKYEGKYYEWRYLGYAENGVVIENPFFPPDYPNDNFNPLKRDWWLEPWKKAHGHPKKIDASYYDRDEMFQQKVEWFVKYLFPELPEFRRAKQFPNIYDDAADWARKFSLRTNPDKSTGVIVGFHGSGYYATFTLKPPKLPNMRVIEMKVWDKETGELIGHMINPPPENPCNPKKFMRDKRPINNSEVAVGDTLIIQATVQYFNDGDKSPTEHKPLKMLQMVAIDEDAVPLYANEWTIKPVENVLSSSGIEHLNPGDKITFDMMEDPATGEIKQWEFTVTQISKKNLSLRLKFQTCTITKVITTSQVTTKEGFASKLKSKTSRQTTMPNCLMKTATSSIKSLRTKLTVCVST